MRAIAVLSAGCVLLAALLVASCSCSEKKPPRIDQAAARQWVCESCGHTFLAPHAKGVKACPKCGKEAAIRSFTYKCGACGRYFEAYRYLDTTGLKEPKGPDGKPIAPGFYIKKKGGEWVQDEEMLGPAKCPHCGNTDRTKMEPAVPPADE